MHNTDLCYYLDTVVRLVDLYNLWTDTNLMYSLAGKYLRREWAELNRELDIIDPKKIGSSKYYFKISLTIDGKEKLGRYKRLSPHNLVMRAITGKITPMQKSQRRGIYQVSRYDKRLSEVPGISEDKVISGILGIMGIRPGNRDSIFLLKGNIPKGIKRDYMLYIQLYLSKKLGLLDRWL